MTKRRWLGDFYCVVLLRIYNIHVSLNAYDKWLSNLMYRNATTLRESMYLRYAVDGLLIKRIRLFTWKTLRIGTFLVWS